MSINLLPEEIVNQIAAGEVIENPAAVVKELFENSIDAWANEIFVEVFDSGFSKIVISDNGSGILKEDLVKAPLRHATSKISSFNDLYSIKTMGFRGEALASIFSVAKTRLVSRTFESSLAYEVSSENFSSAKEVGGEVGTRIVVEDLFYNVPARKKYLKSSNLELKAIVDVMQRFCVLHFDKKIVLKHNGSFLFNKPKFKSYEENLVYVLGKELRGKLFEFEDEILGIKVKGFLGKPSEITYSYLKNQFVFVNSRFVKSKIVRDAVIEGFGTNLMEGRHPFFVLFIEIDPEIIDVNVHPTKIEIRFENELEIFNFVKNSVKKVFESNVSFKNFEEKDFESLKSSEKDFNLEKHIEVKSSSFDVLKAQPKNYFLKDVQKNFDVREDEVLFERSVPKEVFGEPLEHKVLVESEENFGPLYEEFSEYRIVGVLNKTYVVLETKSDMFLIDFHAAEEKCFFEEFVLEFESGKVKTQFLLKSLRVEVSQSEMLLFKENKEFIERLGFVCDEFGDREVVIRGVPFSVRGDAMAPEVFRDILGEIGVDKSFKNLEKEKVEKLASKACRRAIKAGYEMTIPEIKILIEKLRRLKEPFNCPHGRPTILKWSFYELEKKFKRIV